MTPIDFKDKSRTSRGKTYNLVMKHNKPPADQNGWGWFTVDFMCSVAFRSLSVNAVRAIMRLVVEHSVQGGLHNGQLIVTHQQFKAHGVSGEYVADAIDELAFKGLVRVRKGRAGAGSSHPNVYRLTWIGDHEGAPPTNEWKRCTEAVALLWSETIRKQQADKRGSVGRKKKTPLRETEIRPLRDSETRMVANGSGRGISK